MSAQDDITHKFCMQRIAGRQLEMSSERLWVSLLKEFIASVVWQGGGEKPPLGIRQIHDTLSGDFFFFLQWHVTWHMQAALCGRIEQKQKRAEAEHDRVHNIDTYLLCSSVHGCLNGVCAGSSYVWLRPVNESQSLPTLADTDSNQRLMKSL